MLGKQQCKLSKYNFRFILPKIYTIRPYANKKVKGRLKNFRRPFIIQTKHNQNVLLNSTNILVLPYSLYLSLLHVL